MEPGARVTGKTRLVPGVYELADPNDKGAIVIEGDGVTLDLGGVTLVGSPEGTDPNAFVGRGIVIRGKKFLCRAGSEYNTFGK